MPPWLTAKLTKVHDGCQGRLGTEARRSRGERLRHGRRGRCVVGSASLVRPTLTCFLVADRRQYVGVIVDHAGEHHHNRAAEYLSDFAAVLSTANGPRRT